jgi:formate hydrogenlyase transcriptional activator
LNVFPITIPPLRDRPEDIAPLVRHFVQKFANRMNKRIETVSADAMAALSHYAWPGNARELENAIERAVILTNGPVLRVPASEFPAGVISSPGSETLEVTEREAILRALLSTNWVVSGPHGAAARLGLKRTTLQARMRKLGIRRGQP